MDATEEQEVIGLCLLTKPSLAVTLSRLMRFPNLVQVFKDPSTVSGAQGSTSSPI